MSVKGVSEGTTVVAGPFQALREMKDGDRVTANGSVGEVYERLWQDVQLVAALTAIASLAALLLALSLAIVFGYMRLLTAAGVFGGPGRGAA